jgi:hypothetical protein
MVNLLVDASQQVRLTKLLLAPSCIVIGIARFGGAINAFHLLMLPLTAKLIAYSSCVSCFGISSLLNQPRCL